MALALRLRRVLVAAATSSAFPRPATSASTTQPLPLASLVPLPLPGPAVGFRSRAAAVRGRGYMSVADNSKIFPDKCVVPGCDYNHWVVTMNFPDPKPCREEMIEIYLQTLTKVFGSYAEAKKRMYAFSTTTYTGFQAVMTREMSEKFHGLPGVVYVVPDAYLYPERKEYGGDKYDNGVITSRPPYPYWGKSSRPDRSHNFQGTRAAIHEENYQNIPPMQQKKRQDGSGKKRKQSQVALVLDDYLEHKKKQSEKTMEALLPKKCSAEEFSVEKCLDIINAMELTDEEKAAAAEAFESDMNREMFMMQKNLNVRLIWLRRKISRLLST